MSKKDKIESFKTDNVAVRNNNFIGLPFTEEEADIILLPVPWDVTVSFGAGTHKGPTNILESSYQLDLFDSDVPNGWKQGYYFAPIPEKILKLNQILRPIAEDYISKLEDPDYPNDTESMNFMRFQINEGCSQMIQYVYEISKSYLDRGKLIGLIGGDHSTPFGFYKALAEKYDELGIIVIDAHLDLREAYEGLTFSHASIYYNTLKLSQIKKLVQVGIRDCAHGEVQFANQAGNRVEPFYDSTIKSKVFEGHKWDDICKNIVDRMPENVIVSIDIDGLNPALCPNTGTPVPGGLEFQELVHLLQCIPARGKKIVGFDICEVAGDGDWDGNVGARIVFKLGNLMGRSWGNV
jgi:agmatinase